MRRLGDVVSQYDSTNETDRKKIILIKWFQKHPGRRFDRMEIHQHLEDELNVGQERVGQYLGDLVEESVLEPHGEQRISYRLKGDILIPIRYQIISGFRHISTIFDFNRWGVFGFLIITTILWGFLTLPLWFFSAILILTPADQIGPISGYQVYILSISMTLWLIIFVIFSHSLYILRRLWHKSTAE